MSLYFQESVLLPGTPTPACCKQNGVTSGQPLFKNAGLGPAAAAQRAPCAPTNSPLQGRVINGQSNNFRVVHEIIFLCEATCHILTSTTAAAAATLFILGLVRTPLKRAFIHAEGGHLLGQMIGALLLQTLESRKHQEGGKTTWLTRRSIKVRSICCKTCYLEHNLSSREDMKPLCPRVRLPLFLLSSHLSPSRILLQYHGSRRSDVDEALRRNWLRF